jgi:hypothetical protein
MAEKEEADSSEFKFKLVEREKKVEFPEVPEVPGEKHDDRHVDVPNVVRVKKLYAPEDSILDINEINAPEYIKSEMKKIDIFIENKLVLEARKAFEKLKPVVKRAQLSEKLKNWVGFELKRLDTGIKLLEI